MKRGYTREWHRARIGTMRPALCGKKPPGGRPWKAAPKEDGQDVLPACSECEAKYAASQIWLAA